MRPRDAATLLILDRSGPGAARVLMGRRHMSHRFMPGAWVFPGGRVDPADSRAKIADDYHPAVLDRLMIDMRGPKTAARARAFAVAAIRETWEEAGVCVGRRIGPAGETATADSPDAFATFAARGLALDLSGIRFVARAVTPPGLPRRFDTRFLAVDVGAVGGRAVDGVGPSGELEDIAWVSFDEARARPELARITRTILDALQTRLADDPNLDPGHPVPFYRWTTAGFSRRDLV